MAEHPGRKATKVKRFVSMADCCPDAGVDYVTQPGVASTRHLPIVRVPDREATYVSEEDSADAEIAKRDGIFSVDEHDALHKGLHDVDGDRDGKQQQVDGKQSEGDSQSSSFISPLFGKTRFPVYNREFDLADNSPSQPTAEALPWQAAADNLDTRLDCALRRYRSSPLTSYLAVLDALNTLHLMTSERKKHGESMLQHTLRPSVRSRTSMTPLSPTSICATGCSTISSTRARKLLGPRRA